MQPPRSPSAKVEGRDAKTEKTTIQQFESLTKQLLSVSQEELKEQEKLYKASKLKPP